MSFLSDIAKLASAGYSVNDVKELIALNKSVDTSVEETSTNVEETTTSVEETSTNVEETATSVETTTTVEETTKDDIDYKSLYEESQKALKEAQATNRSTDISANKPKSLNDSLADIARSFM